jgi:hypothetical protein
MLIRNISGQDLEVADIGFVADGDTFEAAGEQAIELLKQDVNFKRADRPKKRAASDTTEDPADNTQADESAEE